jgi:5-methylcytosine-specific restriction endonuclease McrA
MEHNLTMIKKIKKNKKISTNPYVNKNIDRQAVLEKYNKHCAYCGKKITLRTMQVDHIVPKARKGTDDFSNLNPSCRRCNHYKRALTLEEFRKQLSTLINRLKKNYINKVAVDFGIIEYHEWDKVFYYERKDK